MEDVIHETNKSNVYQEGENTDLAAERNTSTGIISRSDNLELYLKDVYEKECVYDIENEEIQFIQTGIENTVNRIAEDVCRCTDKYLRPNTRYTRKNVLTWCERRILHVGSYYEQTKNHFPNEFDFILVLGCYDSKELSDLHRLKFGKFKLIAEIATADAVAAVKNEIVISTDQRTGETRKLYVDGKGKRHGPAVKMTCIYERSSGRKTTIHVDITPAVQITNGELLKEILRKECDLEPFHEEVLSTGSVICIGKHYSFTETEVHFMKNVLSENHVKVYRILKYLINGHGDGEKLDEYVDGKGIGIGYSSYNIKTLMIYHHYKCRNSDSQDIGPCILDVLEDMCRYATLEDFPSLTIPTWRYKVTCMAELCLRSYVQLMAQTLKSMQTANDQYHYDSYRIKESVSRQYLDKTEESN